MERERENRPTGVTGLVLKGFFQKEIPSCTHFHPLFYINIHNLCRNIHILMHESGCISKKKLKKKKEKNGV